MTADEVKRVVTLGAFDAVMISVALKENLEEVSAMIRILRLATDVRVPLIVGGGILKIGLDAAQRATGAGHVTNSPAEALRLGP